MYGFLGPNGAGKTTTLRMALGLIMPTEGTVELFGRDPMREGARALEGVAGFVEAPRFYPYLTARKNLELLAALDGDGASERIEEVLEVVELSPRANHRVGGYSHGMRQRLGIAAALLRRPRLLILDEPATGLDPAGMRDMRALIRRLADEGITVLLSSHQLPEVQELCDRVAIVDSRARRLRGRAGRPAPPGRSGLPAAHDRRRARARRSSREQPGIEHARAGEHGLGFQADERDVGALSLALGAGRRRHPRAHTRAGDARGPVLPADRERRRHGGMPAHGASDAPTATRLERGSPVERSMSSVAASPPLPAPPAATRAASLDARPSTAGSCASSSPRSAPIWGSAWP